MKTWQDQLRDAGYPAPVLVIDFETYYDSEYHLGTGKMALSTVEYVADPRFEIHGFGLQILGHPWESLGRRFVPKPKVKSAFNKLTSTFGTALHNCTVVAKTCKFDLLILAEKFGLYPPFTVDIDDLLRYYDSRMDHRLEAVAPLFGLPAKGDTKQFKGQHFDQIDMAAMAGYCLNDVADETELFKQLLPIVDNPAFEFRLMRHTLGMYLRPRAEFDATLAARIRTDMQGQIDAAVGDVTAWVEAETGRGMTEKQLSGDISFVRLLQTALGSEPIPVKPGKPSKNMIPLTGAGMIPAFSKDDDGCKAMLGHKDALVRGLMTARLAVSSWPGHIGRIDKMAAQARASRGLVRVPQKYYGAHTGRWSGEEGVNLANLGGSGRGKAIGKLISEVRHTIRAPAGQTFVLCDAAQIEARNLAWYAGQEDLVQGFRDGTDIYSEFATDLFQVHVWKPSDEEKQTPEGKRAEIYRGFGKDAILGCGYGMGADKFFTRCLSNEVLRPLFDSGEYNRDFVGRLIKTYRSKFPFICKFWGSVERAWRIATRYKREESIGNLTFWHEDGTTCLRLPSGRVIRYRGARVNAQDDLIYMWGTLWGGSLTENIVQATCRDPLGYWILEIERQLRHTVVHHVYDETITLVPEGNAEDCKKDIEAIMSTGPVWADGMPFKAEGSISKFYKK